MASGLAGGCVCGGGERVQKWTVISVFNSLSVTKDWCWLQPIRSAEVLIKLPERGGDTRCPVSQCGTDSFHCSYLFWLEIVELSLRVFPLILIRVPIKSKRVQMKSFLKDFLKPWRKAGADFWTSLDAIRRCPTQLICIFNNVQIMEIIGLWK